MVGSDRGGLGACGEVKEFCTVLAAEPAFTGMEATANVSPLSYQVPTVIRTKTAAENDKM